MHICLIGFMKSGKSTISQAIANKYGLSLISLDQIFVEKFGPIGDFFLNHGEDKFRKLESSLLLELDFATPAVIDCGGGIVEKWQNMLFLRTVGTIIYLRTPFEILTERTDKEIRPNWHQNMAELQQLYERRDSLYTRYADVIIDNIDKETTLERIVTIVQL